MLSAMYNVTLTFQANLVVWENSEASLEIIGYTLRTVPNHNHNHNHYSYRY